MLKLKYIQNIFLNKNIHNIIFVIILIFLIFIYFAGIVKFDYIVPPGDDGIRHMTEAKYILTTGETKAHSGSFDPPLFHILLASLTSVTGLDLVEVTKYFAPFLAILATLSIYFIVKRYFYSKTLAIIAILLYAIFSPQPQQIYGDGTYLNIFGASFLLIFALAVLPSLQRSKKINIRNIIIFSIFASSLLLSHSLSSVYLLLILSIFTLYSLLSNWKKFITNKNIIISYLILGITLIFTWEFYLRDTFKKIISILGFDSIGSENILKADFSTLFPIPNAGAYYWFLNYLIIILAIFGFIFSFKLFKQKNNEKMILCLWALVMFIGSRTYFFQLPQRFARDMAVILLIFASIFVFKIISTQSKKFKMVFILIFSVFLAINIAGRVTGALKYDGMMRIQTSDEKAMAWIRDNTSLNDTILGVPATIVVGDWGSYIELLTDRKTLDGNICPPGDEGSCDPIYDPNSKISVEYYVNNSIDYVYAGKAILGSFILKDKIDWSYHEKLSNASFLVKTAEFPESELLGGVIIYKVNEEKLIELQNNI